ncbi:MAG: DUF1559 domain-containing protein [Abitibacteriaceae bacterium]|nr:DUF1559 domain-containing protein [Abditibacteriaceae bacterium]
MNPDRYTQITQNVYIDRLGTATPRSTGLRTFVFKLLLWCLLVSPIIAALYPCFMGTQSHARIASCLSNLKQVSLGVMQYVQDNDECYPLSEVNDGDYSPTPPYSRNYGWADALYPYLETTYVYHCPSTSQATSDDSSLFKLPSHDPPKPLYSDPSELGFTDYWLNRNVCGVAQKKITNPAETFLLGDGNTGHDATTARYTLRGFPTQWLQDQDSPLWRHTEGANFAYADGHVHWIHTRAPSELQQSSHFFNISQ